LYVGLFFSLLYLFSLVKRPLLFFVVFFSPSKSRIYPFRAGAAGVIFFKADWLFVWGGNSHCGYKREVVRFAKNAEPMVRNFPLVLCCPILW
jgi:hypothetical protein